MDFTGLWHLKILYYKTPMVVAESAFLSFRCVCAFTHILWLFDLLWPLTQCLALMVSSQITEKHQSQHPEAGKKKKAEQKSAASKHC